jgi:hypothetical protein
MSGWNLPPGCSLSDIPGNRPEDIAFDHLMEKIYDDIEVNCLTVDDVAEIWKHGLTAWKKKSLDKSP